MTARFPFVVIAMLLAGPALADFELQAPDGRRVVLQDDFTWHYKQDSVQSGDTIIDNWNRGGCSTTDHAGFALSSDTFVTRLITWYDWQGSQQSAAAEFRNSQGRTITGGQIRRGGCDDYQPNWCQGILDVNRALPAGQYVLEVSPGRICQNAGSAGQGFLQVVGQETAVPPPAPVADQALGCYRDDNNRDLSGYGVSLPNMTTQTCISTCAERGFAYAGTQFGSQCFCGDSYGRYGTADNCNMPCNGNANEICGGTWANSLYGIGGR